MKKYIKDIALLSVVIFVFVGICCIGLVFRSCYLSCFVKFAGGATIAMMAVVSGLALYESSREKEDKKRWEIVEINFLDKSDYVSKFFKRHKIEEYEKSGFIERAVLEKIWEIEKNEEGRE